MPPAFGLLEKEFSPKRLDPKLYPRVAACHLVFPLESKPLLDRSMSARPAWPIATTRLQPQSQWSSQGLSERFAPCFSATQPMRTERNFVAHTASFR